MQPCLTRCRQNVGSTKTCIKNMKKKIICVGTTLYKIVNQSHIDGGYMKKVLSQAFGDRKAIAH
ncbi:hypothetical protein DWZ34_17705 [Phocaeicola plebeius]|uniref:Uncharacterized protein n=1 Tax=Phocaeicola plebeius TaxID=310297 RepID=A0A415SP13_9BACT|nr:hypothetical protein DWZ34_17705 [Phocaeicola plebeius]